jgi:hypothetical protein
VSCPRLDEVRPYWADDPGALLDAYVSSASLDEWQLAVDCVRVLAWPSSYSEDGKAVPMPLEVSGIFARRRQVAVLWQIRPSDEILINSHFFDPDEIEFDFDPREIVTQRDLDVMCEFVCVLGRSLKKPVAVGIESVRQRPHEMMRYEPTSDCVVVSSVWQTPTPGKTRQRWYNRLRSG